MEYCQSESDNVSLNLILIYEVQNDWPLCWSHHWWSDEYDPVIYIIFTLMKSFNWWFWLMHANTVLFWHWWLCQYADTILWYRKSHCGDKSILRSSYLHNGISYTFKTVSSYWKGAQVIISLCDVCWVMQIFVTCPRQVCWDKIGILMPCIYLSRGQSGWWMGWVFLSSGLP